MAANSIVGGQVWLKIKLIEALIVILYTCKNDEDLSKNESTSVISICFMAHSVSHDPPPSTHTTTTPIFFP